jgi:predicted dithiol-disulfide oxidoreductase (DUF899 family)
MNRPQVVSEAEWQAAREELLIKEKELTRQRHALAAERRRLPMVRVEKDYVFEGPDGEASLLDLFDGRRQLIVYRFFFEPGVERVMNLGENRIEMRIPRSAWFPRDLRFPHS